MADAPAAGAAPKIPGSERVVNPTTVLILGFVTCGLYMLYWKIGRASCRERV